MNALKTLLTATIIGVSIFVFVVAGQIVGPVRSRWRWQESSAAMSVPGYHVESSRVVRGIIICIGFGLASFYI